MGALGPYLPAALALVFAAWCGSFGAGAGWAASATGSALVLAAAPWVGSRWRDPWRLGSAGSLLLWALLAAALLSWLASPVARAGTVGVTLLPAYLALPAVVARAWGSEARRRHGLRALSAVVAVVAAASLVPWLAGVTERPALPVGQHLHLTAWLALLLPLALLPWRDGAAWRWLAGAAGALGVAAVLGGRTLAGGLVLVLDVALGLAWYRSSRARPAGAGGRSARRWLPAAALGLAVVVVGAVLGSDLVAVARGTDPSFAARRVYWRAGWDGLVERPAVGLGPGSTAWILPAFLRPVPGINPPSEAVGDLHLLPLAVAFEVGVPGFLLATVAVGLFVARRGGERGAGVDPGLLGAGLLGLAGGAATGFATADWRVTALPVAAAVAAGAMLAGGRRAEGEADRARARPSGRIVAWLYVLAAAAALAPIVLAHRAYDLAVDRPRDVALRRLGRAVELDPRFPLYRARRGWLEAEDGGVAGGDPLAAARAAVGVAPFWLAAGAVDEAAGERATAALAYERACALDPLSALPPFRLAQVASPLHDPLAVAARALAADPRLAAASWWRGREALLDRTVLHLATTPGLDEGWRAALAERAGGLAAGGGRWDATGELALVFDRTAADSVSLHLFRRTPWWGRLAPVPVDRDTAEAFADLPAATSLESTDRRLFPPTCTGAFVPQRLRKTLWKSW